MSKFGGWSVGYGVGVLDSSISSGDITAMAKVVEDYINALGIGYHAHSCKGRREDAEEEVWPTMGRLAQQDSTVHPSNFLTLGALEEIWLLKAN